MASGFNLPEDTQVAKKIIDHDAKQKQLKIRLGLIGRFFGSTSNTKIHLVGLICLILIIIITIYTFLPNANKSQDLPTERLWNYVLPVVTTLVGFIFGYKDKNNNNDDDN
jgi:hypothetical protein